MEKIIKYFLQRSHHFIFFVFITFYLSYSPSTNLQAFDSKRIAELALISIALMFTLFQSAATTKNHLFFNLPFNQTAIFFILALLLCFSSFLAASPAYAFLETSLYLGLFFFCLFIANIAKNNNQFIQLFFFITFSLSALLYQTNFFTAFLASLIENIPMHAPEPFSGFSNIRFFNQYQIWSIFLLPLPLLLYPSLDKRLLNFLKIIAIGWALLLFASGSRGAIGSVFVSMILTFIVFKKHAVPFLKLNLLILLTGVLAYLFLFKLVPTLLNNSVTTSWRPVDQITQENVRILLWQFAIQYIIDNPLLGIGPMHYAYFSGPTHAHPHNSILQWTCEMGIPSTLLMISLLTTGLIAWVKKFYRMNKEKNNQPTANLWIALFCTLCSGLIYSLVSGVIIMPLSQLMMVLIIGWMLGFYYQDQKSKPINLFPHLAFKLLAGLTLITLTYTAIPSLLPRLLSSADLPYQNYPVITPRFWQIGGIPH